MLRAYLDESGQQENGFVVVGGFLGNSESWQQCAREWMGVLSRFKRPSVHCVNLDFNSDVNRVLLEALVPIPESCGLRSLVGSVNVADYADLVDQTVAVIHSHGYTLALAPLLHWALRKIPADERLELVFEEQTALGFYRDKMLSMLASMLPDIPGTNHTKLAGWTALGKSDTCLFQPADVLCYHLASSVKDSQSNRAKWTAGIVGKPIGEHYDRDKSRRIFSYLQRYSRYPEPELKELRRLIRRGEFDPWAKTFD